MNRLVALSLFLMVLTGLKAQDGIITTNKDTILCRIVSIDNGRILYEVKEKNGSVTSTFIDATRVASFTRSVTSIKSNKSIPSEPSQNSGWNFQMTAGLASLPWYLDNAPSATTDQAFYKSIKTGYQVGITAINESSESAGIGLEYSFFTSGFRGNVLSSTSSNFYAYISEHFNQYIHFLGPSIQFKQFFDRQKRITLCETFSGGALLYRLEDQTSYPNITPSGYTDYTVNTLMTTSTLAAKAGLTATYRLNHNLSIGLGSSFTYGTFKNANLTIRDPENSTKYNNQELSKSFNLSRIDYSFVVRYQY